MGMDPEGILAYGYNLGQKEEIDFDNLAWLVGDDDDEDDEADFLGAAERVLLASVGFTETDWRAEGYHDRKRAAEERLGVKLVIQCTFDQSGYILSAKTQTAEWGDAQPADLTVPDGADERLDAALAVLGVPAKNERPTWLLSSFYG